MPPIGAAYQKVIDFPSPIDRGRDCCTRSSQNTALPRPRSFAFPWELKEREPIVSIAKDTTDRLEVVHYENSIEVKKDIE